MTYEERATHDGAVSHKSKPPLDVRIVAYYLYVTGFLALALSLLLGSGIAKPLEPFCVLIDSVQITGGLAYSIYMLCTSVLNLLCAWGLMRRERFAWWLSLLLSIYWLIEWLLRFPKYPVVAVTSIGIDTGVVVWLWFRRGLYGGAASRGQP